MAITFLPLGHRQRHLERSARMTELADVPFLDVRGSAFRPGGADFSEPYPARIICELLGIPRERQAALHGAANRDPAVFGADDGFDMALSPRLPGRHKELP
jgi:hypothetical protein